MKDRTEVFTTYANLIGNAYSYWI